MLFHAFRAQEGTALMTLGGEDRPQKLTRTGIVVDHDYPQRLHRR
jgi:hypothetical protein